MPTVLPGTTGTFPFLYQGWTLWYEMLFYAAALAAMVSTPQRQMAVLTVLLAALIAFGMLLRPQGAVGATYTDPLLAEFLIGYWFAVWRARGGGLSVITGTVLMAAGVTGLAAAAIFAGAPEGWPRVIWWGLPAMVFFVGAVSLDDNGRIGEWPLPRLLGDASYAIYLSHGIAVSLLLLLWRLAGMPFTDAASQIVPALVTFALATAIGVTVHLTIERPVMAWFRRRKARLFAPARRVLATPAG